MSNFLLLYSLQHLPQYLKFVLNSPISSLSPGASGNSCTYFSHKASTATRSFPKSCIKLAWEHPGTFPALCFLDHFALWKEWPACVYSVIQQKSSLIHDLVEKKTVKPVFFFLPPFKEAIKLKVTQWTGSSVAPAVG